MTTLAYDSAIEKHLRPGERLRWVGRPRQGWRYRWANRVVVVQAAVGLWCMYWVAKVACWAATAAGLDIGISVAPPTVKESAVAAAFVAFLVWQLWSESRRRHGTWYGVTDRRLLFVLTSVWPESVIGVEFKEIGSISRNEARSVPASRSAIVIMLKHVDPYLCLSSVLGYQVGNRQIVLEDMEEPEEFIRQAIDAKAVQARMIEEESL